MADHNTQIIEEDLSDFLQITGQPWSPQKRLSWYFSQIAKGPVIDPALVLDRMKVAERRDTNISLHQYGTYSTPYQDWNKPNTPLMFAEVGDFGNGNPVIVLIGGVHGYEPGPVEAALRQLEEKAFAPYLNDFNFAVIPSAVPWSLQYDTRYNANAFDPNRLQPMTEEMYHLTQLLQKLSGQTKDGKIFYIQDGHETPFEKDKILRVMRSSMEGKPKPSDEAINKFVDGLHIMVTNSDDPDTLARRLELAQAGLQAASSLTPIASNKEIAGYQNINGAVLGNAEGITGRNHMQANLTRYINVTEAVPDILDHNGPKVRACEAMGLVAAADVQMQVFEGSMNWVRQEYRRLCRLNA